MESRKHGKMEKWKNSTPDSYRGDNLKMEEWKNGIVEEWKNGKFDNSII